MLDRLLERIPKEIVEKGRFNIPTPNIIYEGRRTTVFNFKQIAAVMNRDARFITSFIGRETAAPAIYDDPRLIIQAKVDRRTFDAVLNKFLKKFVLCPACKGPDTKLVRMKRILTVKCEICGTETPVEAT
jgi:translation initiation factor 2 subunit 2